MKEWQRPITTRRYLHPPMSERMVTLWSEGKIILGEVEVLPGPRMPAYSTLLCCGVWPVFGTDLSSLDFRETENIMQKDGIPVHKIRNIHDSREVTIEAFCNKARKTSCFIRMCVKNIGNALLEEQVGLLLRTGLERNLVFGAPDVYDSYAPDVEVWKQAECTWMQKGEEYEDGEYFLRPLDGTEYHFEGEQGLLYLNAVLKPGEQKEFVLLLGKGNAEYSDYETERQEIIKFYEKELERINKLPEALRKNEEKCALIRNLTIQLLQCFAKPVGEDFVLCRQGGLQRNIWTFEALYVLEALGKLGDFADYIEPVVDSYFTKMQAEDGEVLPMGIYWAMASANALFSFSEYAIGAGREYFEKYRERALRAYECIKKTRAGTEEAEGVMVGLYPPRRSCDCALVFQSWTFTDTMNLIGLQKLGEMLKFFGDPMAEEVEQEYLSYRAVVMECFEHAKKLSNPGEGICMTSFVPGMRGDETLFAFAPFTGVVTWALDLGAEDVEGLETNLRMQGRIHEGLRWKMPAHYRMSDADGVVRMWYTTLDDYYWFLTYKRLGRQDLCEQIIESTLKYSMTTEFYMLERYHERDPYFCPWSPNASGNGRLLLMLCAF